MAIAKIIVLYLKHHLSYKCIHRKHGTLLYRTGGDLLTMLSHALGRMNMPMETITVTNEHNGGHMHDEKILSEAGFILNDMFVTC